MEELIVWFFERLAFLRNTEPEERESDGLPEILRPIRDEPETIAQRERALMELQETLNDPGKRETLSEQFATRSDALFMATFQLGEIEKVIQSRFGEDECRELDLKIEKIEKILQMKPEDVPGVCIEVEPG